MAAAKAGWQHQQVMWLEPGRRAATVMGCVLAATGGADLLGTSRASELTGSSMVSVLRWAGLFLLCAGLLVALANLRRWRTAAAVRRFVESEDAGRVQPDGITEIAEVRSSRIPQLEIDRISRRGLPTVQARRVSPNTNVAGYPPMRIAYLRLFDNQPRARTFLEGAWREFGTVFMLRSASSVSPRELRALRQGGVEGKISLVRTRAQLLEVITSARREPLRRRRARLTGLAPTSVACWDWHGSYQPVAMLCHGDFWKEAVDELLLRVDLVCLDLSGFQRHNEGTAYELQRVVDRFPLERVAFLCDPYSDTTYLSAAIQQAWARMAVGSPNEGIGSRWTQMADTDTFITTIQVDRKGQEQSRRTRLHARRRQTRRLAAELQRRLAGVPEPPRNPWRNPTGWVAVAPPRPPVSGLSVLRTVAGALVSSGLIIGAFLAPSAIASQEQAVSVRAWQPSPSHVQTPVTGTGTSADPTGPEVSDDGTPATSPTATTPPDTTPPDVTPPDTGPVDTGTVTVIIAPAVLGRTVDDAVRTLTQAGLRSRIEGRPSDRPAGEVLDQNPPEGARVAAGQTVVLTVSTGPTPTNTPPPPTGPPSPTTTTFTSTATVTVPLPDPVTTTDTASDPPRG